MEGLKGDLSRIPSWTMSEMRRISTSANSNFNIGHRRESSSLAGASYGNGVGGMILISKRNVKSKSLYANFCTLKRTR